MREFNVIVYDFNHKTFIPYDVMPYLVRCYNKELNKPKTFEEFKKFIEGESKYQWWSRCEYEIILESWPNTNVNEKWDVHRQVMMNIDIITSVLMDNVNENI